MSSFGNMCVIGDMLRAVAVVALAPGAVAELQVGRIHIGAAADGAFVGIGGLGLGMAGQVAAAGGEGDGLVLGMGGLFGGAPGVDAPGDGEDPDPVLAEEQEVVAQGDQAEEAVGEGTEQAQKHRQQIQHRQDPSLDGDDEEDQELGIGVKGGVGQKQAHVQIGHVGLSAEDHAVNIHQQHARQIEQVEPQGSPDILDAPAHGIVADHHQHGEEAEASGVAQGIGKQPPDLAPEDGLPVKGKEGIQGVAGVDYVHQRPHRRAQGNVKHQIGDALVPVAEAEAVEFPS